MTPVLAARGLRLAAAAALLALCACSPFPVINTLVPKDGLASSRGLAYGDHPRQRLDVYTPQAKDTALRPVVIFFYGGGWQQGERADHLFVAEALVSRGFVVVVPDYRLYPEVRYPQFVEDGARAVAWTSAHIAGQGGDPKRLFVMGHSAGAHIAAMLAYNRRFLDAPSRAGLRGFIGLAGPYDFAPSDPATLAIMSGEGEVGLAMPASFVKGGEPPSLLVIGEQDSRVGPEETDKLARRLRAAGSPVDVLRFPSKGHAGVLLGFAAPFRDDDLVGAIERFVRQAP